MSIVLLIGCFVFVFVLVAAALYLFERRAPSPPSPAGELAPVSVLSDPELPPGRAMLADALKAIGERVPSAGGDSDALRRVLISAGYRYASAVQIYYGIKVVAAVCLGIILFALSMTTVGDPTAAFVAMVCGVGIAYIVSDRILDRVAKARAGRIRRAIPAALDLMVLSVEAGQSLNQAILDASSELKEAFPDLSSELAQVHLELRAGEVRAQALSRLGQRVKEPELKRLATVLIDSDRFGTSLAPALRTHATYLRTRMRQQAQETARKVSVKLIFPVFFLIFPSVMLVTLGPAALRLMQSLRSFTE